MSGVMLRLKKSTNEEVNVGSRDGSVSREEFSLQILDLDGGSERFRAMEIGAWSEIVCSPIFVPESNWRSLCGMNK